ncbi:MAG: NUDIX domain-containing protein [Clostridia bacterium]|nr:NUDIX domain-containing protein [Clostridia bacterium]
MIRKMEYSCGAVVFWRQGPTVMFVIVQEMSGKYSFPKGHMEDGETPTETARREILEETGLEPDFIPGFIETNEYVPEEMQDRTKHVTYFLAEYTSGSMIPRAGEVQSVQLMTYDRAMEALKYEGSQRILRRAMEFIRKMDTGEARV